MIQQRLCPSCMRAVDSFTPGPGGRPDAACPHCGSLERDRFLALLLQGMAPYVASARTVLDIAPNRSTTRVLRQIGVRTYVRLDFDPGADRRAVDVQASVTDLPFADGCIDVAICYHVLEHVPDDTRGMSELARVLSPGGIAFVQVPWRPGTVTDEDPSASVEERLRRFGQADHVRYYGDDFEQRLAASGLSVFRFTPRDVLAPPLLTMLRLSPDEPVWLLRPGARGATLLPADGGLQLRALDLLYNLATGTAKGAPVWTLQQQLKASEARAALWERRYRKLRGRLPIRVAAAGGRLVRTARGKVANR